MTRDESVVGRCLTPLTWNVAIARTGWRHVLAFASEGDRWIVFDPHARWTGIHTLSAGAEFDAWVLDLSRIADIWRIEGGAASCPFAGLFCVGKVKHLIGLRSGALSPWGLARDLRRAGARRVFVHEGQDAEGRPVDQGGS